MGHLRETERKGLRGGIYVEAFGGSENRRPEVKCSFGYRCLEVLFRSDLATGFAVVPVEAFEVKLGGQIFSVKEGRLVPGIIKDTEGRAYKFGNVLYPVSDLGQEDGKRIDVLFGAVILEDWGAIIIESTIPLQVDYYRLRKGEQVEL